MLTRLGKSESCDRDLVARVYDMTLDRLNAINRRLWFKFSYNLAEIFLAAGTFDRVEELMHDLWAFVKTFRQRFAVALVECRVLSK